MKRGPLWALLAAVVAAFVVARAVRLDPDVATLLPVGGLATYARAFGGGEAGFFLVEGDDADVVAASAASLRADLSSGQDDLVPVGAEVLLVRDLDLERRLAAALTPEGARVRLADSRALLLGPGGAALSPTLSRDPLRLAVLAAEVARERSTSKDGRAAVVVAEAEGGALVASSAATETARFESARDRAVAAHPGARVALAGSHPIASWTEQLVRKDLVRSGLLSLALSALALAVLTRRLGVVLSVVGPLLLGAVVTGAFAACFDRMSAVATAFVSVVVGVGTDTGVHVVDAVRRARASGASIEGAVAAVARPALGAAVVAGATFGLLALSSIPALRQLGILAAIGEVVTAVVILVATPALAARLGGDPPPERGLPTVLASRAVRWIVAATTLVAVVGVAAGPLRPSTDRLIRVTPRASPFEPVYARASAALGRSTEPPVVLLVEDATVEAARVRIESLYDAVASAPGLTRLSGPPRRVAARVPLDLRAELAAAGFSPERFARAALELARPSLRAEVDARLSRPFVREHEGRGVAVLFAETTDLAALRRAVAQADGGAHVTGYGMLEDELRATLGRELPRIGVFALLVAALSLGWLLRRGRDAAVALVVLVAEVALVLASMRAFGVPLHAYDALVLPVLFGITADEVLFVLAALRRGDDPARALAREAPLVATTAVTTAAGFAPLCLSGFDPLRHIGFVGAAGSLWGLVLALCLVPLVVRSRAP